LGPKLLSLILIGSLNPAALNIENLGDADYLIPGGVCDSQAAGIWKEIKARAARSKPILGKYIHVFA
jgi:hypothetical protein